MIVKVRCEAGCARADELGDMICKRCMKAQSNEVESTQERTMRQLEEQRMMIDTAEEARERIMKRVDSLDDHHTLLVMSYVGAQSRKMALSPLSPMGRAATILLFSEALVVMVPEENRPWMKDGHPLDMD